MPFSKALFIFFLILFIYLFIYLFLAELGLLLLRTGFLQLQQAGATLRCVARASHCGGFSCCGARALGTWASVVVARGLSSCGSWALQRRLSSCGARAQLLRGMWDLPRAGLEPVSPALAGGFLTTAPPGKPSVKLQNHFVVCVCVCVYIYIYIYTHTSHTFLIRFITEYCVRLVSIVDEILVCCCFFHYTFSLCTQLMMAIYTLGFGKSKKKSIKCHPVRHISTLHKALVN